jgi:hypothetical protein
VGGSICCFLSVFYRCLKNFSVAVEIHFYPETLNFPFVRCSYCCACGLHPAIIAAILHKPIQLPAPVAWWQLLT